MSPSRRTSKSFRYRPADQDKKKSEPVDSKEEKIRREVLEKRAKREMEAVYQRNKVEQEKELERKKKEFNQNLTKKNYTFEYDGGIMYLKPFRDDNIAVNEITEIVVNAKKNLKVNNPTEFEPRIRTAEIIEKEGPLQSSRGGGPTDEKVRKPKVVGMFKPAPHVYEVIQVVGGVTFSVGKNLVKKGQVLKTDGKLKYDQFRQKHLGIEPPKEDSDLKRQREKEQKEAKEKKYRRTIDNWKEELKKGLKPHLNFDPDLLINLIMTDDHEGDQQKKVQRRAEREKKVQTVVELKVEPADPEKTRGNREKPREVPEQSRQLQANRRRSRKFSPEKTCSGRAAHHRVPKSHFAVQRRPGRLEERGRLVPDAQHRNGCQDVQVHKASAVLSPARVRDSGRLRSLQPVRIRNISSAVRLSSAVTTDSASQQKQFAVKRVQSGNLVRRPEPAQAPRLPSGTISQPKKPDQVRSDFQIKAKK